jgi:hypothetical protein
MYQRHLQTDWLVPKESNIKKYLKSSQYVLSFPTNIRITGYFVKVLLRYRDTVFNTWLDNIIFIDIY